MYVAKRGNNCFLEATVQLWNAAHPSCQHGVYSVFSLYGWRGRSNWSFFLLLPGDQPGSSSNGSVIPTGAPFIILLQKSPCRNWLLHSHQQEVVVLVGTNPIGPLRHGSRLFCASTYDKQLAEMLLHVRWRIVPLWRQAPHFTLVSWFSWLTTTRRRRVLGQSCRGLVLAPRTTQPNWLQSIAVSHPFFVWNREGGGVERAAPPCGARSSPAVSTGVCWYWSACGL